MVAPYKRTGLMTSSFQGPSGAALSEGIRTSNALTSQLNQMSNFFFNQAARQREIEGTEYGSANAPTIEQIAEATKTGESLFDFAPTVYGQAAKRAALAQIENEIIVDSTKRFDELVFTASKNMSSPTVLRNDLDAAIAGYDEILNATSPSLANKMKAKLALTAHGQFDAYRKSYQKAMSKGGSSANAEAIIAHRGNFAIKLEAVLSTNPTPETVQLFFQTDRLEFMNSISSLKANSQITQLDKYNKSVNDALVSLAVKNITADEENNLKDDIKNVREGILLDGNTNEIALANIIVANSDANVRSDIAQKLREIRQERLSIESQENDKIKIQNDATKIDVSKNLSELTIKLNSNDPDIRAEGLREAEVEIQRVEIFDFQKGQELREQYLSTRGFRQNSDIVAFNTVQQEINELTASFDTLAEKKNLLSFTDYQNFRQQIIENENEEYKLALLYFSGDRGFKYNPEVDKFMGDEDTLLAAKKTLYDQGKLFIKQKLIEAQRTGEDFDGLALAEQFVRENIAPLKAQFIEDGRKEIVSLTSSIFSKITNLSEEQEKVFESVINNRLPDYVGLLEFLTNAQTSRDFGGPVKQEMRTQANKLAIFLNDLREFGQ